MDYGSELDVARNLKALFPNGFSDETTPTDEEVLEQIQTFRARVRQVLRRKVSALPSLSSDAGRIATDAVVSGVCAWVCGVALAGRGAEAARITQQWDDRFRSAMQHLRDMPEEAEETATRQVRVRYNSSTREAGFTDEQLRGAEPIW